MAYSNLKVTQGEVDANNVKSAPDRLSGTATQNKNIFDKLVELFVAKYNALCDELDTNTYTAIDPITINGFTISHADSGITQGKYGSDDDQYPTVGGTFTVPYFITDSHGHLVSAGECDVTIPVPDYDDIDNRPQINSNTLTGDKSSSDLGLADASHSHTTSDITDFPTLATVATTGDYDDLLDKPSIPTNTSDLNNDSGFLTSESDPIFTASDAYGISSTDITAWNNKSDFSGSYNDLTDKPTIPVKNIWYATCSTGASTTAKTATSQTADFTLATGNMVRVLFTNTNTATSPTISIDGSTAKNIRIRSGSTGAMTYMWRDNEVVDLVYDGTTFVMSDGAIATTTYYGITTLSSSTSSTSETVSATPKAVKTAYDLANGKADAVHTHTTSDITDFPSLATVATSGDYSDLDNVPTDLSDFNNDLLISAFTNDAGYITSANDVFWATYGTTTSAQLESAYQAGKLLCVFYSSKLYTLRYRNSATNHRFTCNYGTSQYQLTCSSNTWSTTNYTFAQTSQLPSEATSTPLMDGTAAVGSSSKYAKEDHVHPTDTSRAASSHTHTKSEITDFPAIPTITDTYSGTSSDGMSGKAVKSAIDALDGTISGSAGSDKTLTAFSQTDGKVSATFGNINITKSQVSDFPSLATVATSGSYTDLSNTPTIPANTSDLNNDSGFISSETDPVFSASDAASITFGSSTSKFLAEDGQWRTPAGGGGGTSDYDQLSNRPQINSNTLTGNKSSADLGLASASHSHTKSDITDFPTIPTKTSDLNNDSGFISSETDPVFSASAASGIASSDITNWNGKSNALLVENKEPSGSGSAQLVTLNANSYGNSSFSVSKTGYTPIGVLGVHISCRSVLQN